MKERVTISVDDKVIKLVDSLVGKNNLTNRSQAIESVLLNHFSASGQLKAVILAGKRPSQESIKETLAHLEKIGVSELVIAGGKNNEAVFSIVEANQNYSKKATFLKENMNLGTAGAIKSAENMLHGTFFVIYSDINYSLDLNVMLGSHYSSKKSVTMAVTIPGKKSDLVDKIRVSGNSVASFEYRSKAPTKIQNAGIFIFEPKALDYFPTKGTLEDDVLPQMAQAGEVGMFLFDTNWKHTGLNK
ncbi:MAG: sugar phosphate nucleotidyltransferase [archaeon]|nr:sugar phosphate nucleotidyltransferase [archaeon]